MTAHTTHVRALRVIGFYKLAKSLACLAALAAALRLTSGQRLAAMVQWLERLRADPHNRVVEWIVQRVPNLTHDRLRLLIAGLAIYTLLYATQGLGLIADRRWAEYLTIVTTGLLLPVEFYEVLHTRSPTTAAVLVANIFIVAFLSRDLGTTPPATTVARDVHHA
jgi:uncharacterized membrane protein (DUF2068 family)